MAVFCTLFAAVAPGQDAPITSTRPASVDSSLRQGSKPSAEQKLEEALKAREQAAALDPNNESAVVEQYIILVQLKRIDDATKVLEHRVAAKPDDPRRWQCKALCEAQTDRPAEALKSFEKLIQLQPEEGSNWIGKGQMLAALNRNDEALSAFDKALKMRPERTDVWSMKGWVQGKMGKYDDAIRSCNKAIELLPKDDANYTNEMAKYAYNRACVYALKGDKASTFADLKKAIELDPSFKSLALKDEDFESLNSDADFKELVAVTSLQATAADSPPPQMEIFQAMIGNWEDEVVSKPAEWTPNETRIKTSSRATAILNGHVVQNSVYDADGQMLGIQLLKYDPEKQAYRQWHFDSRGVFVEATGQWDAASKTLTLTSEAHGITGVTTLRFVDQNTMPWSVVSKDKSGKIYLNMEGKATRQN
jgi:tetratricopeptide (TPR) repeat protein